jgi:hypothetical protein
MPRIGVRPCQAETLMAKQSKNDPDRLAQMQQSDLSESRINEEFVDWLKRWGNTILLVILAVALAGVGWNWLQRKADTERDAAWANLAGAQLPASLEEVAKESKGVDSVTTLALLNAADQYLTSIQNGTRFDRESTDEDYLLDDQTRALFLERANTLYAEAILSVGDGYQKTFAKKVLVVSALFGQAAIAESQGNIEESKRVLARIVDVSNPQYPQLASQATARTESLGPLATPIVLPAKVDLPEPVAPVQIPDPAALLRPDGATTGEEPAATESAPGDASSLILEGAPPPAEPAPAPEPIEPAPAPEPSEPAPAPGGGDGG